MNFVELNTPCGAIKGIDAENCYEFRGIEYAKSNRYEYANETKNWQGTYDATKFGACSYQRRGFVDDEKCNAFYHKEFRKGLTFEYSEDCLYLNIWAPKNANNCPVIIYIHGGSFTGGSSNEAHINGTELAKNGVMLVAMNYRLNAFGFCSHPHLTDKDGKCGNFGLYDQLTAISWVRNNIFSFGGNPNNITLMGQSAGAMSVDLLISSPMCKGWFSGAIMMSGAGLQRAVAKPLTPEKTKKFWDSIIANAGVSNINELKTVDQKTLFYAWSNACKADKLSMLYTLPVIDGKLVAKDSFNMATIPNIPYILGVTSTDMAPIALEVITKKFAKAAIKNGANCYVYNFFRDLPGDNSGAWHSCDLLYAFGTLKYNWRPFEAVDYKISNEIISAFCSFATNGNPNCDKIPTWNTGYKLPMRFCENTQPQPWNTKTMLKNTFGNKGAEF